MSFLRGKDVSRTIGSEARVVVDLGNYDVKGDTTVLKVKFIDVSGTDDVEKVRDVFGRGDILLMNMNGFRGSVQEMDAFTESIHTLSRSTRYKVVDSGSGYLIATPDGAKITRI